MLPFGSLLAAAQPPTARKDIIGDMSSNTRREFLAASALGLSLGRLRALPLEQIKLGVTTDEIDDDVLTAVKFLKEYNLRWAEVRNIWGKYNTAQPVEKVKEANGIFDSNGIKVSIDGTPFFKVPLPAEGPEGQKKLDQQWAVLDAAMERAKLFGTDKMRVFGFTYGHEEKPAKTAYGRIYELIAEAGRRAKAQGLRLALENVNNSYIWTGEQAGQLLKHVKADNVGMTWDPNNAAEGGEHPFPDGYRKLDPARIFHVHVRDFRHNAEGKVEWAPVGGGEFDNVSHIRAMLKDGYKGTFTLETHWKGPGGKAASSATSLKGLLKVIEQV
jgi:L-ribulose-5-phosphate 3-epimerase